MSTRNTIFLRLGHPNLIQTDYWNRKRYVEQGKHPNVIHRSETLQRNGGNPKAMMFKWCSSPFFNDGFCVWQFPGVHFRGRGLPGKNFGTSQLSDSLGGETIVAKDQLLRKIKAPVFSTTTTSIKVAPAISSPLTLILWNKQRLCQFFVISHMFYFQGGVPSPETNSKRTWEKIGGWKMITNQD